MATFINKHGRQVRVRGTLGGTPPKIKRERPYYHWLKKVTRKKLNRKIGKEEITAYWEGDYHEDEAKTVVPKKVLTSVRPEKESESEPDTCKTEVQDDIVVNETPSDPFGDRIRSGRLGGCFCKSYTRQRRRSRSCRGKQTQSQQVKVFRGFNPYRSFPGCRAHITHLEGRLGRSR